MKVGAMKNMNEVPRDMRPTNSFMCGNSVDVQDFSNERHTDESDSKPMTDFFSDHDISPIQSDEEIMHPTTLNTKYIVRRFFSVPNQTLFSIELLMITKTKYSKNYIKKLIVVKRNQKMTMIKVQI